MIKQFEKELVKELIRRVTLEELTSENLEKIRKIVEELEKSDYIQAIAIVDEFLKYLGVNISRYRVSLSISTIVNKLIYLRSVGVKNVRKVVKRYQHVVSFFVDIKNLQGIVEYLMGVGVKNVGRVIERYPSVLGYSVNRLERKFEYLTKEIGLSINSIETNTFLLGLSLEKRIKPRWEYIKSLGTPLTESQIIKCLKLSEKNFEEYVKKISIYV